MLKIQRASAGSGKTYALAKNYILNLIAYKDKKGLWKLRNDRQIEDALIHILAITFTNKATNEMKQRIVKNLSLLSSASKLSPKSDEASKIPYLIEFQTLLNSSYKEIAFAAEKALTVILNNYSYFKISTIDSFFQEILRIFTYEANLTGSYQLEIDSTFVNDMALDSTIQELDSHPENMGNSSYWLKLIIAEEARKSQKWNLFNRRATSHSVYSKLRKTLSQLESEDFKEVKSKLDNYFDSPEKIKNLISQYKEFRKKAFLERETLLVDIKKKAETASNLIVNKGIPDIFLSKSFLNHLEKIRKLTINEDFNFQFNKILSDKSVFLKKYRVEQHPLDLLALDIYSLLNEWNNPSVGSYFKNWLIYGELIPYLGLILEIRSFITSVLESHNLLQLSDTNYILKQIIGDDDAPFIYERIGNRVDHFLIDEFQDTSRMQWDILFPLINESESKGLENLIIGDPKQSIYRFRNADHKLLTNIVPALFPNHSETGLSLEENTNWRSHSLIVKFNNFLFKNLSHQISNLSLKKGIPTDFDKLYQNVVQYPQKQDGKGYVEIRYLENSESLDKDASEINIEEEITQDWFEAASLSQLGPLISSLLNRGYKQKDIGILVNNNDRGSKIIEYLVTYNETLPKEETKIDFISEESLLISSSPAVELIIGIFHFLSNPGAYNKFRNDASEDNKNEPDNNEKKYFNWNKLKIQYKIFSQKHSEQPKLDRILKFLKETAPDNSIPSFIEALPSPSIASIIEGIVSIFIDEEMKTSEAIYIASLQDVVNEYSANHPIDPASFLEWWNSRGKNLSVSTPIGIDAVQIMTIHKSKGLEFKCVILPFVSDSFLSSNKEEWRWVSPQKLENLEFPPVLPIKTTPQLLGSKHDFLYREYIDQIMTDKLNMYYVAFTRAMNELYVFSKKSSSLSPGIANYIKYLLLDEKGESVSFKEEELDSVINIGELTISDDRMKITLGTPFTKEEISKEQSKDNLSQESYYFKDYYINNERPKVRSLASKVLPSGEME